MAKRLGTLLLLGLAAASVAQADRPAASPARAERHTIGGSTTQGAALNFLWQDVTHNLDDTNVTTIAVDATNATRAFIGTTHALYRTTNGGRTWERQCSLHGAAAVVRAMLVLPRQPQRLIVATDQGLWLSRDGGTHWQHRAMQGRRCLALLADPGAPTRVWLGTTAGLYRSDDDGASWQLTGQHLDQRPVYALAGPPLHPQLLYVVTDIGLLVTTDHAQTWRHSVFSQATGDERGDTERRESEDDESRMAAETVTAITCNPESPHEVIATTSAGAIVSRDDGRSWAPLPTAGLARQVLRSAVMTHASAPRLYVAGDRGVWTLDDATQQWQELYRGMTATHVRQLAVQALDGSVWAATDRGVFHGTALPSDARQHPLALWALFQHEPTIDEVQAQAVRYSETDPAKISRWRRAAATKALLPTVSFGVDRNRTITDHYDEGTYPKFQVIPTHDIDRNLGVRVSWNLGELIWNNDQTSIDARSKLTAELRDQILAEITRLYFERRRLQVDMAMQPCVDSQRAFEQDLRVQELTAQLDAFTGGWFSRALEGS